MKTILIFSGLVCIIVGAGAFYLFHTTKQSVRSEFSYPTRNLPDLNVYFAQDVSKSIVKNAVMLVNSVVFTPYFNEIHRNITLSFGVIQSKSSGQLLQVRMPAATFFNPDEPDLSSASSVNRKKLKTDFELHQQEYIKDSLLFFETRQKAIKNFCYGVDSIVNEYQNHLTDKTDIGSTLIIAQKLFAYTGNNSAIDFLLLNSDGRDSYHKDILQPHLNAKIILINSGAFTHTSIDKIVNLSFQNPTQAIQYTLNHLN